MLVQIFFFIYFLLGLLLPLVLNAVQLHVFWGFLIIFLNNCYDL